MKDVLMSDRREYELLGELRELRQRNQRLEEMLDHAEEEVARIHRLCCEQHSRQVAPHHDPTYGYKSGPVHEPGRELPPGAATSAFGRAT